MFQLSQKEWDALKCQIGISNFSGKGSQNVTPGWGGEQRIFLIRGQRVIIDTDLARLYGVETKALNRAVKRNTERFPEEFVFRLTQKEWQDLRYQLGTSKALPTRLQNVSPPGGRGGRRYLPYAFTEFGALMAANVLNSSQAVKMSL